VIHKEKPPVYKLKRKKTITDKKDGRPQWDGKDHNIVIAKLEEAWMLGASDQVAALAADISASSLCRYLEKHPELSQRAEQLKKHPVLKAIRAVNEGLENADDKSTRQQTRMK
jgi:hypothetical protein